VKKAENNKINKYILAALLIAMSLILIYVGHFLFVTKSPDKSGEADGSSPARTGAELPGTISKAQDARDAVRYTHRSETLNGLGQEINMLEIDPGAQGVKIMPVLSYDLIYGFEKLSAMAQRKNAYAAVNGGFFHVYGQPSGMVVINGEICTASTGKYPVFTLEGGKAVLEEIDSRLSLEYGKGAGTLSVDGLNVTAQGKQTIVYTPVYGKSNRAQKRNITATVVNGVVTKISDYSGEAGIPENGMLISFFDTLKYSGVELPIKEGDSVKLMHSPGIAEDMQAYECGSWLVRNGAPVVKDKDAWVGIMTNRDPRTAVGIKADGTVILLTVDGRQPGYSAGFTGQELAEYLIGCGASDAAMLDGGASTEMLLEGKLVNRPSYGGQERDLAGGIVVLAGE
jgi:exopolysaccharide biosynthesis protein